MSSSQTPVSSPMRQNSSSTPSSSYSSREVTPETRNYRAMSPFVTPDMKLDEKKYKEFLKKMDILEIMYYSQNFNRMVPKYSEEIMTPAKVLLTKRKRSKTAVYILICIVALFLLYWIDIV